MATTPTTRRELITLKYNLLGQKMKKYTDEQIFPSLEDVDVADLVYFISITFLGVQDDEGCRERLNDIIETHNIKLTREAFNGVYPCVKDFLDWLKSI
jgi:hypothetical protein